MAETRFIKTVVFGGYDKGDVDKKLEYLYTQFYDMKNKLREAKLIISKMKDGTDEKDAAEAILGAERAKLTELQVKNETLSERAKSLDDDNKKKDAEIEALKAKLEATEEKLKEAEARAASGGGADSAAMLGVVFQQAQSSANVIITTAQKQASDLEADSKKLAENMVTDANNKAKKIIYDAEVQAAQTTADAESRSAAMDVASSNMKAVMLSDVERIGGELERLKAIFDQFEKTSADMIGQSQKLVSDTKADLTAGGVPVFKQPGTVEATLPEEPQYDEVDNTYATGTDPAEAEEAAKKNEQLDKLKAMAGSMGGGDKKTESAPASGGVSLADLAKKAGSLGGGDKKTDGGDSGDKKSGGVSLADLAKKAKSIK